MENTIHSGHLYTIRYSRWAVIIKQYLIDYDYRFKDVFPLISVPDDDLYQKQRFGNLNMRYNLSLI
jgi:hypothetical protein